MRPPLLREAANICRRFVRVRRTLELVLIHIEKQYRPVPPGLDLSQRTNLSHLEELQRYDSPELSEDATVEETAAYVEGSLQEGLGLNLDYMETVSRNIALRVEAIERANAFAREGYRLERLLELEMEALKHALFESIGVRVSIRAHSHFLRFCTWLKDQEETGCVEELVFWEKSLLGVHNVVKREVEEALRLVAPGT